MPEDKPFILPKKLKVDKKKRYHIPLPEGGEKIVELTDREINIVENWFQLVGKHNLRANIVNILRIYDELNVTQISQMIEQSKPTVSRHLKSMELDGLLVSRIVGKYQQGRIPPKLFKINQKVVDVVEHCPIQPPEPSSPHELIKFYQREIASHRAIIHRYKIILDKVIPLLDMFEGKLNDLAAAKEIWENYFDEDTTNTFPDLGYFYFSEKYFDKFNEVIKTYTQNLLNILAIQNADPDVKERDFVGIYANLPIKALYEIYKKEILEKKK